jgi:hypothetical protein
MSLERIITLGVSAVVWAVFIWWTLRKLGSLREQGDGATLGFGVTQLGMILWVGMIALASRLFIQAYPNRSIIYFAVEFGVLMLPICLWAGFFWGKGMTALFPGRRLK